MKRTARKILPITLSVLLCLSIGFISSAATRDAIPTWYAGLQKPFFTPPNSIFGPVWTLLYILMGWSAGRIWYLGQHHRWGKTALYHFGMQLVFNGLWSIVFFGMKNPALGILVILILWILIERCVKWFGLIDKLATRLLYPYWAWVTYATALNIGIWWLN